MSQDDKRQEKKLIAIRRELAKLCDKTEKTLVPLQRVMLSAVSQATNPELMRRIDQFHARLSMVNAALHQLQGKRYERDGGASKRIATRLVNDMSAVIEEPEDDADVAPEPDRGPIFEGRSPGYPLADVLGFLENQRKTGCLQVQLAEEVVSFGIAEGNIVHTSTNQVRRGERLGELLIEHGDVTFEHMMAFMDAHRGKSSMLGMALVEGKIVSQEALTGALIEQLQRRFDRAFAEDQCSFAFFESPVSSSTGLSFGISEFLIEHGLAQSEAPPPAITTGAAPSTGDVWDTYGVPAEKKFQGAPNDAWGTDETK